MLKKVGVFILAVITFIFMLWILKNFLHPGSQRPVTQTFEEIEALK